MSKKTIIIIIVAVALLFFLLKKGVFKTAQTIVGKDSGSNDTYDGAPSADDSFSYYINRTSMTAREKEKALQWCDHIAKACKRGLYGWSVDGTQKKADEEGITYNQQICRSALWQMHATDKMFDQGYCNKIMAEIEAM